MKLWMQRLLVPTITCLFAACIGEFLAGMLIGTAGAFWSDADTFAGEAGFFGKSAVLWNILFRSAAAMPVLYFFCRRDEAVRRPIHGHTHWSRRRLAGSAAAGAAISACSFFLIRMAEPSAYAAGKETLYSGDAWLSCAVLLIAAPLSEELFFRGILYRRMREKLPQPVAGLCSAVLFGLYHGNIPQGVYGCLAGLLLAWVTEQSQGVKAPFFVHMSANAAAVFLQLLTGY